LIDTTLSHFRITAKLGEGGMGEVYLAEDTTLGRQVAIKVLPKSFTADSERLARFKREARVLAALEHPNIATLYEVGEADGVHFLVMQLADGEDLATHLQLGPIPVHETLEIALQIAQALEAAHDSGIVHRDLKPANVTLAPDGQVKVLDFGLAKAMENGSGSDQDSSQTPPGLSLSPTLTAQMTQDGVLLGTAAYMSPEQARGKPVDRRTDNWAFGALLWEMLTGERCFSGETVTDLLSSITRDEPDLDRLPADTPPRIRELISRCTRKEISQRLQHIGDGRVLLEEVLAGKASAGFQVPGDIAFAAASASKSGRLGWLIAAGLAVLAGVLGIAQLPIGGPEVPTVQSLTVSINPPEGVRLVPGGGLAGPPVLSPDGQQIAYVGRDGASKQSIFVRPLDEPEARKLEGTEGAHRLFWSPDSQSIGFFTVGAMHRVPAVGGPVVHLADAPDGRGGSWGADGTILFAPNYTGGLFRVSEDGGAATPMTEPGGSDAPSTHRYPLLLPDGKHFLFLVRGRTVSGADTEVSGTYLGSIEKGEMRKVLDAVSNVLYAHEHLLFVRDGILMAQPFDPEQLEVEGEAKILAHNVRFDLRFSRGVFSAVDNGPLIYQQGEGLSRSELRWHDQEGKVLGTVGEPDYYVDPRIAPDNRRIVFRTANPAAGGTLWTQNLETGFRTRFTFPPADAYGPVWSPDGRHIAFGMVDDGERGVYVKATVGGTPEELLLEGYFTPQGWSPDGKVLIARSASETGVGGDLWAVPLDKGAEPTKIAHNLEQLRYARMSPDGRWILHCSAEASTGLYVRVEPFPPTGSKWQVSTGQAMEAVWTPEGDGIIFASIDGDVKRADIRTSEGSFEVVGIRDLFSTDLAQLEGERLDIAPDGRLLISVPLDHDIDHSITFETGWTSRLSQ
jgi:Tol biopolymer transport system component/tRNA A-37 threonylcarbamoyl transferase component Bud32